MYDIIIIGAGPAGLTAALYALRANKKVLVTEKGAFGGQITYSPKIENYPGFIKMSGNEFADKLVDQVLLQGADIEPAEVLEIIDGETKKVVTDTGEYECKSVIIATGAKHRRLGLDNEDNLVGNGISFCAVCDGAFCKGKTVGVVGGGNSALQEAILLTENADKVMIFQDLPYLTGEDKLVQAVKSNNKIEIITSSRVTAYLGEKELTGIRITPAETGEEKEFPLDALFIAIGLVPQNEAFANVVRLNERGYVDADESCLTSAEGIFVAGDCREKKIRQITTATSDGAIAALAACSYIDR